MNQQQISRVTIALTALFLFSLILAGYFIYQTQKLRTQVQNFEQTQENLRTNLSSTTNSLVLTQKKIALLTETLNETGNDLKDTREDLREEKDKNEIFEDQIKEITGTVSDLDKLSKTDEELLQKYSKVYFLNENYIPSNIRQIDDKYILEGKDPQFFHGDALSYLKQMIRAAAKKDITLKIVSAYRSFDEQTALKGQFTQVYGSGANAFSADQGYSEHQLGTTVDLTDPATGGTYVSFAQTESYQWLLDNAYKYGFTLSYPNDNGFYTFEPWHWRFVGEDLADNLRRDKAHFYDWDQRDIDEYLIKIFD